MKNIIKNGISMPEVVIIISIIFIITAVALPQFSNLKKVQVLKNAKESVISGFNKARVQTLASLNSSEYGVHFEQDKITIFKGTTFVENDVNNEIINIIPPAIISNISLTGGATDFYFSKLGGLPSKNGTIVISISGDGSLSKTLTISGAGIISSN